MNLKNDIDAVLLSLVALYRALGIVACVLLAILFIIGIAMKSKARRQESELTAAMRREAFARTAHAIGSYIAIEGDAGQAAVRAEVAAICGNTDTYSVSDRRALV